jgi:hypothetical protein
VLNAPAALTVNVNEVLVDPKPLIASKIIFPEAVTDGVPDKTPPTNVMPVGRVPLIIFHAIGAVPVAVNVVVGYSVPTVPVTKNAGDVITGAVPPPPPPEVLGAPRVGPKGPEREENI